MNKVKMNKIIEKFKKKQLKLQRKTVSRMRNRIRKMAKGKKYIVIEYLYNGNIFSISRETTVVEKIDIFFKDCTIIVNDAEIMAWSFVNIEDITAIDGFKTLEEAKSFIESKN